MGDSGDLLLSIQLLPAHKINLCGLDKNMRIAFGDRPLPWHETTAAAVPGTLVEEYLFPWRLFALLGVCSCEYSWKVWAHLSGYDCVKFRVRSGLLRKHASCGRICDPNVSWRTVRFDLSFHFFREIAISQSKLLVQKLNHESRQLLITRKLERKSVNLRI